MLLLLVYLKMLLLHSLFLFILFDVEILYFFTFFKVFFATFFLILLVDCLLFLVKQLISFFKLIFLKVFSCCPELLLLHHRELLTHFEQYPLMLLIHICSEIKIEFWSVADFVQINLVNFIFNQFLLHLVLILLLMPFAIKLNFKALLREEIIKYFIDQ